jgi:hypothetical protein
MKNYYLNLEFFYFSTFFTSLINIFAHAALKVRCKIFLRTNLFLFQLLIHIIWADISLVPFSQHCVHESLIFTSTKSPEHKASNFQEKCLPSGYYRSYQVIASSRYCTYNDGLLKMQYPTIVSIFIFMTE